MSTSPTSSTPASSKARFLTTRWSIVLSAAHRSSPDSQQALESLCRSYWYPLYAFARRMGKQPAEAQDVTQAFFARLLEKEYLRSAEQEKGRFRTFLLIAFKRFLANEYQRDQAQKRGGGETILSINLDDGERRLQVEPAHTQTAEQQFERRWALTLLDQVLERLRVDYQGKGKLELFERLKMFLTVGDNVDSYREIAEELEMSEGAIKVAVHRLRRRYRDLIREEVASTIEDERDAEDELQCLLAAIRVG